jgi:hypothetical protein
MKGILLSVPHLGDAEVFWDRDYEAWNLDPDLLGHVPNRRVAILDVVQSLGGFRSGNMLVSVAQHCISELFHYVSHKMYLIESNRVIMFPLGGEVYTVNRYMFPSDISFFPLGTERLRECYRACFLDCALRGPSLRLLQTLGIPNEPSPISGHRDWPWDRAVRAAHHPPGK